MPTRAMDIARNQDGTSAVEYALLLGLVAAALVVAIPPVMNLFIAAFDRLSAIYGSASP